MELRDCVGQERCACALLHFELRSAKSVATPERQSACGTRLRAVAMAGFTDAHRILFAILLVILGEVVFAAMDVNAGKQIDVVGMLLLIINKWNFKN